MTTTLAKAESQPREDVPPHEYRWDADAFHHACEVGVFGRDQRLELLHGRIIDRMPESALHAFLCILMIERLRTIFSSSMLVVGEKPVRLSRQTEPIPDVSVLSMELAALRLRHPGPQDVALLVEVAVTSQEMDLGEKAALYAQAGITEYWVVLPEAEQIVVHRQPASEGFRFVARRGLEDEIAPQAASGAALSVRELLGARS